MENQNYFGGKIIMKKHLTVIGTLTWFVLGLSMMMNSLVTAQESTKYFSSLRYNHVSLHGEIKGIHPIDKQQAAKQPHYVFTYGENGRLVEIENNFYNNQRLHPLTNFGVKYVKFSDENGRQIREFYDVNREPMINIRGVQKEVYHRDESGFVYQLNFYDKENQPVESRWNINEYRWHKKGDWVIEQRFNLKGEKQPLSPYFPFNDTAIEYNANNEPYRHYNLNSEFEVVENEHGIAFYQDTYDGIGQHVKYAYYDSEEKLTLNQWQFAYGVKQYDEQGYYKGRDIFDAQAKKLPSMAPNMIKATAEDDNEITRVSKGYIQALRDRNPALMIEVLHPNLAKHTIPPFPGPNGEHEVRATTYEQMLEFAKSWNLNGVRFPPTMNIDVTVLDKHRNMATVKMVSDNWVEYLHLVKLNGQWKIKNLLWDYH